MMKLKPTFIGQLEFGDQFRLALSDYVYLYRRPLKGQTYFAWFYLYNIHEDRVTYHLKSNMVKIVFIKFIDELEQRF